MISAVDISTPVSLLTCEISKFTNQLINKINGNLERFNYNVFIANMYETYNFLSQKINNPINKKYW